MRILITGAHGFLGNIIYRFLRLGHEVATLGTSEKSDLIVDLRKAIPVLESFDMVVHCAGKAHVVPKTEEETQQFFQVNHLGTKHLLDALQQHPPRCFVFISTVAVYGREEGQHITEAIALDGSSAYALSKIKAEEEVQQFASEHHCNAVILRLPLVVGSNAPGNLGAMVSAIKKGYYFRLGKGDARRSMVLAQDVAELIPSLIDKQGIYNLTDGIHPSFFQLEQKIASAENKKIKSLPITLIKMVARMGDFISVLPLNSYRLQKLTATLTFSDEKARKELHWQPNGVLDTNFLS